MYFVIISTTNQWTFQTYQSKKNYILFTICSWVKIHYVFVTIIFIVYFIFVFLWIYYQINTKNNILNLSDDTEHLYLKGPSVFHYQNGMWIIKSIAKILACKIFLAKALLPAQRCDKSVFTLCICPWLCIMLIMQPSMKQKSALVINVSTCYELQNKKKPVYGSRHMEGSKYGIIVRHDNWLPAIRYEHRNRT